MDKKDLSCLRCGHTMRFCCREKLQLGQTGWILGDLPNLLAGSLEVDIHCCENCGKLEFYATDTASDSDYESGEIASRVCPNCGHSHDMDYPKCPYCRYDYGAKS